MIAVRYRTGIAPDSLDQSRLMAVGSYRRAGRDAAGRWQQEWLELVCILDVPTDTMLHIGSLDVDKQIEIWDGLWWAARTAASEAIIRTGRQDSALRKPTVGTGSEAGARQI